MKPTCQNCGHAMERDPANMWCRRYPPQMFFVQVGKTSMIALPGGAQSAQIQGEWISTFPSMQKTGLCGEWKQHGATNVDQMAAQMKLAEHYRERAREAYEKREAQQPIEANLDKLSPEQMKAIREEMAKPGKLELIDGAAPVEFTDESTLT